MSKHYINVGATNDEWEEVFRWLREYNHHKNGSFFQSLEDGAERELYLSARDEDGTILGGFRGMIRHQWLIIDIMATHPDARRQGIGTQLLHEAERLAGESGCTRAYVDTMSYQAPEFYAKHDYKEIARLQDWDSHDHDKCLYVKSLSP